MHVLFTANLSHASAVTRIQISDLIERINKLNGGRNVCPQTDRGERIMSNRLDEVIRKELGIRNVNTTIK